MRTLVAARQVRCFSSSPGQYATEIKQLGVLGAGQMVRQLVLMHVMEVY